MALPRLSDVTINLDYVQKRAKGLGQDVLGLWLGLVDKTCAARK